jgi:RNA polymerase sigma-70 factor (ECF subfamily)
MQTKSGLITKLAIGDPVAFRDIFNLLYPRMMGYCKLFVKDHFQAEDLVQDCFVQLWNKRETLDSTRNIDSLLFVMLRNHCLNFLRDHRLDNTMVELKNQYINEFQYLYHLDFIGEEEKSLEDHLITSLTEAIDNLPDRQKEVFLKTKVGGQSQKEVATELGITVKAIEKNVAAAKRRIRDELGRKFPALSLILLILFQ